MMFKLSVCAAAALACSAQADIGAAITTTGGDVVVTIEGSTASYTSDLYYSISLDGSSDILIGSNRDFGQSVNLGNFAAGQELVFRLFVRDTGDNFFSGNGARNADGLAHANVEAFAGYSIVGFEDILGGGDFDYDDCTFRFENVTVPAPSVTSFAAMALLLGARRNRR